MNKTQLTRQQKETVGLLSIGSFMEYFDLMLYVHMAVLLNDLFFPKTDDPHLASLYAAIAFCSSYVFRPFGGLVVGWAGDKFGRKIIILISSFTMAASCIVMATVKTYAEIGVTAAVIVTLCRMLQGFSTMGELVGACIYCAETLKAPFKCSLAGVIVSFYSFGSIAALTVATFVLSSGLNWRMAFWAGAIVAIVGIAVRTRLRETPEFARHKHRIEERAKQNVVDEEISKSVNSDKETISLKAILSYFAISIPNTAWFYLAYVYSSVILKNTFNFSAEQIIAHNLKVAITGVIAQLLFSRLVHIVHPLKVVKWRMVILFVSLLFLPHYLNNLSSSLELMLFQILLASIGPGGGGYMDVVCYKYFPVEKRFTIAAFGYGVSHSLGYVAIAFGLTYLMKYFGNYGLWIYITPILIAYAFAIKHLSNLEIKRGAYDSYTHEDLLESELASDSGNIGNKDR